jgi:hypothetical protein
MSILLSQIYQSHRQCLRPRCSGSVSLPGGEGSETGKW